MFVGRLLFFVAAASLAGSASDSRPLSMCDLSKDFSAYRDKHVTVRGVYYYGLRQTCPQKCADGPWPSFVNLAGEGANWEAVDRVQRTVEVQAKRGKRFEIWVTAVGQLKTQAKQSRLGPCDKIGSGYFGYGHLGAFPAELVVESFSDIQVKENPKSPYDYADMYHGPL